MGEELNKGLVSVFYNILYVVLFIGELWFSKLKFFGNWLGICDVM